MTTNLQHNCTMEGGDIYICPCNKRNSWDGYYSQPGKI
jgi:hypothetical protein